METFLHEYKKNNNSVINCSELKKVIVGLANINDKNNIPLLDEQLIFVLTIKRLTTLPSE